MRLHPHSCFHGEGGWWSSLLPQLWKHRNCAEVTGLLGSGPIECPASVFSPPQPTENLCQEPSLSICGILAYSASSLHAYTSVQLAVTKKPGCAVFGEEHTWLNDMCSLLAAAALRATVEAVCCRKTSSQGQAPQRRGCWFETATRGDSGGGGGASGPRGWGATAQPYLYLLRELM